MPRIGTAKARDAMGEVRCDIGVVGMGVMGRAILMNIADHGFRAAAYTKDRDKARRLREEARGKAVEVAEELSRFAGVLEPPRAVLLLVPAGTAVDTTIQGLLPYLEPGDVVIDGGNSHFRDTVRREAELSEKGIRYLGLGVSGGEFGARHGPCLMAGGRADAYNRVRPVLEGIAAVADGRPCVSLLGPGPAGHYVKMVHNGIEYGLMQLIAESFHLMNTGLGLSLEESAEIFARWDQGELDSYLIEITAAVLRKKDERTGLHLVEVISDEAYQKGTGAWTVQDAVEVKVPLPTISAAVEVRDLSRFAVERRMASRVFPYPGSPAGAKALSLSLDRIERGLFAAMVITFAQGMSLIGIGCRNLGFEPNLEEIARIWRGGCIIRARVLEDIRAAFGANPSLPNLLLDERVARLVWARQQDLRSTVGAAIEAGIPVPGFSAALWYLDVYRCERLPTYLIQAQRDYFGGHTYQRTDMPGTFHTDWDR
jgi:6-phosphogluconate dehydrogenase